MCHHSPGRDSSRAFHERFLPVFSLIDALIFLVACGLAVGWALAFYHRLTAPPEPRDPAQEWAEFERLHGRAPVGPLIHGVFDRKGRVNPAAMWRDSK